MAALENATLSADGFELLRSSVPMSEVGHLRSMCDQVFCSDCSDVLARSSRGHVYAARNLIDAIPQVTTVSELPDLSAFLGKVLGEDYGLVRALFFDKPPDRTWALGWHKDTAIAVRKHAKESRFFSRPTVKAGVPHVVASDEILHRMLTLRVHLDDVNEDNGPLKVIPGSHRSIECEGVGVEMAVSVHASAGDVLAMRPLLSHASGASAPGTDRHRRILHLEFADCQQLPDGVQWHRFVRHGAL